MLDYGTRQGVPTPVLTRLISSTVVMCFVDLKLLGKHADRQEGGQPRSAKVRCDLSTTASYSKPRTLEVKQFKHSCGFHWFLLFRQHVGTWSITSGLDAVFTTLSRYNGYTLYTAVFQAPLHYDTAITSLLQAVWTPW